MGFFDRLFGRGREPAPRDMLVVEVQQVADEPPGSLIEVEVVGESHRQDALERIAGPRGPDGKEHIVGVTLRCEPTNEFDRNAIRVEAVGQLVGYVARDTAAKLSGPMIGRCGGALEGRGMIVGGWDDGVSRGHFGIRVWLRVDYLSGVGVDPVDVRVRERDYSVPYPRVPEVGAGERRLSPAWDDYLALPTTVTVTREEHYQEAIEGARPEGWNEHHFPALVALDFAADPHANAEDARVRVSIDGKTIGYFTKAMTARHERLIRTAIEGGDIATAVADVRRDPGKDGKGPSWQVLVKLAMPDDTEVVLIPSWIANTKTQMMHSIGGQLSDGSWKSECGVTISATTARVLCRTRPAGRLVDEQTGEAMPWDTYESCQKCR
ncbi:MAG: hypothetical protein AMXMBFR46_03090 [Acidimicrobiia bacterium]